MAKKINATVWIPLLVCVAFVGGWLAGNQLAGSHGNSPAEKKLNTILSLIKSDYVDDVDLDSLLEYTLPGLLSTLDPHSAYITAADLKAVNEDIEGSFSGVGISFMVNNDTITVLEVISGGPAEKVGIMAGDRIVTIDGDNVAGVGISADHVKGLLRGETDTRVKVGIKRTNSKRVHDYEITRAPIPQASIDASYMLNDSVGYIKVGKFSRTTYDEFLTALHTLSTEGATAFTIDLRGNGGGVRDAAILMANEFLPAGQVIMAQKGRNGRDDNVFVSDGLGSFTDEKVTVLLDEYSASASEILAGAIQDNDRGLIIGRRSFGKGLIQNQMVLPDSSAIRLTIARYYTPSGRCIQKEYSLGKTAAYENDIWERYNRGEAFVEDSIRQRTDLIFTTAHGRTVYGGGGIMPDIFVPNDTSGITGYYINVANAGLLQRFAFEYCDLNRDQLVKAKTTQELLKLLPSDNTLVRSFVGYAAQNGVPARWYYINISHGLIVNQLKAIIARDIIGLSAYYEITNQRDRTVTSALEEIARGHADWPIVNSKKE
ncbi:MAG: PDZ domain-containing protein [Bacteroidales bacterium]|nr:PDZ domain-containing protein [Bacteroidales bacterium]